MPDSSGMVAVARSRAASHRSRRVGPLRRRPGRLDGTGRGVRRGDVVLVGPRTGGQPGEEAGAERRRLEHRRDLDRPADRVGQGGDEHVVGDHPAVDPEGLDGEPGIGLGRLDEIGAAVGNAFEDGPDDLRSAGAPGDPDERAAGAEVPDRRAHSEQRRDEPDVAGVGAGAGDGRRLLGAGQQAEVVAEPLDARPGGEHHGLDAPRRRAGPLPGDDRERPGRAAAEGGRRSWPGAQVEHAAGAERRLGQAGAGAALADQ